MTTESLAPRIAGRRGTGGPINTYRLQLHAGFTFDDARAVLPYLARLGITHIYLSPIAQAAPGSTHGYDVIDPAALNREFGGEEGYEALVAEQQRLGLGQLVDIVPNHMGIGAGAGNHIWEDVLRHGRRSEYASVFDIDWTEPDDANGDQVLLPILGGLLDEVIAQGELTVEHDDDGAWLRYYDHRLPLAPGSIETGDPAASAEPEALRRLLDEQHFRLEYWRTGKPRVNYRRFFAIDDLIGIRTEEPAVFDLAHTLTLRLARAGAIAGVRIDHPDGLRQPAEYLERLQSALADAGIETPYVVLEKILAFDESLPGDWACDGATGYEVMNDLLRVLIATEHEPAFTEQYHRLSGRTDSYADVELECRADVLDGPLSEQFARLARRLHAADPEPAGDADSMVTAMRNLLPHLDRYRTYHREQALDPEARPTMARALGRVPHPQRTPTLARLAALIAAPPEGEVRRLVMQLQQLMPAVQAKGLEDRAFYRYRRLLALNEVGGEPGYFGMPVAQFHDRIRAGAAAWPHRMLTTATHDHKRGEDARMRLAALSERPDAWSVAVNDAFTRLRPEQLEPPVHPDDTYLLLQALVSTNPAGMTGGREADGALGDRLRAYLVKALREAGERTDWIGVDEPYERSVMTLVARAVETGAVETGAVETGRFHEPGRFRDLTHEVAAVGAINALSQVVLRCTLPGVVDTYQGNEFWDLTLVDPDNRRAVDYALRQQTLDGLQAALADGPDGDAVRQQIAPELLDSWRDGRIKMFTLARCLRLRAADPALFRDGGYEPLTVTGAQADRVIAYARHTGERAAIIVVPRLPGPLRAAGEEGLRCRWTNTHVELPAHLNQHAWTDAFTGEPVDGGERLSLPADSAFPVSILLSA